MVLFKQNTILLQTVDVIKLIWQILVKVLLPFCTEDTIFLHLLFSCTVDWPIWAGQLFACLFVRPVLLVLLTDQFQPAQLYLSARRLKCQLTIHRFAGEEGDGGGFSCKIEGPLIFICCAHPGHKSSLILPECKKIKGAGTLCCRAKGVFLHPFKSNATQQQLL